MQYLRIMNKLRIGLAGLGMIVDETYRPLLRELLERPLLLLNRELVDVQLAAVASRTGAKAAAIATELNPQLVSYTGSSSGQQLALSDVDIVAVATPDHRHFEIARDALSCGKHVIIEKPSVLSLLELDELLALHVHAAQVRERNPDQVVPPMVGGLVDLLHATEARLGLVEPALLLRETRELVQCRGDVRIVGPVDLFANR